MRLIKTIILIFKIKIIIIVLAQIDNRNKFSIHNKKVVKVIIKKE